MRMRANAAAVSELEAHAAGLGAGDTIRITCPFCHKAERTMSVTKREDGSVAWYCFRASCGARGVKRDGRPPLTVAASRPPRVPYRGELSPLTDEQAAFLARRVNFDERDIQVAGVLYAPQRDRYAYPVYNPVGRREGWILRSYDPAVAPKVDTKPDTDDSVMASFYFTDNPNNNDLVVIVEDIPSAVRVSRYLNSVALLSTGASPEAIGYIKGRFRKLVVALDKDAYAQSVKLARKLSLMFHKAVPWPIDKDFKDMDSQQLEEVCGEIRSSN